MWSEEAQNAYKMLVQCGNELKYGTVPLINGRLQADLAAENVPVLENEKYAFF